MWLPWAKSVDRILTEQAWGEYKMTQYTRPNSRGFLWIAWLLLIVCFVATIFGFYGAMALSSASFDFEKRRILEQTGWAIKYLDSYFLMTVISAIWIQVCSTARDNENYLISLERKIDELHKKLVQSGDSPEKTDSMNLRSEPKL